ncbi:protein Ead [Salmonella enterica subsp. enterica serovar Panama]|uniref:Protein Ead n=1 Tax=Salmonella enterica subsp. enterica serovar Panama TaxID=29472 RepID=A0A636GFL9_SALET|nr:protein Ead [Salmonella enterica subsp. enterica serovar Panama]EDI0273411.1 protein Ead [Salmonella enterica subsp. enterica serovar Panama]
MTIDKQALREEFRFMQVHYSDPADRARQVIYIAAEALLDELDKKQQYIKLRDQENEDIALTVGKLRVELEHYKSREERVTKLVLDNSTSWDVLYEKLEAAEKRIAEQREYYEGVIADGSKRIAELEKGHQEAAKQINSWRRLAKQNIAERGKDISELEAARQRIAELESKNSNLRTIAHEQNELAIRANLDSINDAVEMDSLHKRIAELEAREVTLPAEKFCPSEYAGSQYWEETEVWNKAISACAVAVRAVGIKVKG